MKIDKRIIVILIAFLILGWLKGWKYISWNVDIKWDIQSGVKNIKNAQNVPSCSELDSNSLLQCKQ